ncbi:SDR family oxidoreductase [Paenibacillus sp. TAB 01]|uniref:SDR family oxidoreductase n=1 Tax=Paenibacillus sp. TAB 01 TaxID=3368988 RepID=UPI003751E770
MNIVITGANRGLGYQLTAEAAQRGHTVIAGIRSGQAEGKLQELMGRYPGQIVPVELDVAREETAERLAEKLRGSGQTVDVVINNAAVLLGRGVKLEEQPMEDVSVSFDINLFGPMRVMKHLLPLIAEGGNSAVINISSEAGSLSNAYGGDYAYALSKAAINMFSKQLRKYLLPRGIRVYALHPGWIKTDMGGEKAPGDPVESARGIIDIVENKKEIAPEHFFINYKGEPMPI